MTDALIRNDLFSSIRKLEAKRVVHTLQQRDLARIDHSTSLIYLNIRGKQCYLILSLLGETPVTYIAHLPMGDLSLVPLKFDRSMHVRGTIARCTMSVQGAVQSIP